NDAPPVNVRLARVALVERLTDLPAMVTKSFAAGTPLGLQLAAVDQLPPDVGPIQVLVAQLPSLWATATRPQGELRLYSATARSGNPSRLKSASAANPRPYPG